MDWEIVLRVALFCAAAAVCVLLLPWLRERVGAEKLKSIWKWVCIAVQAAEQIFGARTGEQKKAFARSLLEGKATGADADTLDALIEAAVRELT